MLATGSKVFKGFSVFNTGFPTTNLVGFGRKLVERKQSFKSVLIDKVFRFFF